MCMGKAIHMNAPKNPLRKLNKLQLLELLAQQEREIQALQELLAVRDAELAERRIRIAQSGSIAEAALKLNDVFEAAQKAADQYLLSLQKENATAPGEERMT